MKKDERLVNLRFMFCLFVGIMLGIIVSKFFLLGVINLFVFILSILGVVVAVVVSIFYAKKIKSSCDKSKFRKQVPFLIKCCSVGFAIAYVVGIIVSIFPIVDVLNLKEFKNEVIVGGVVCDYVDREETYVKFQLKDCQVYSDDGLEDIDYKIVVYSSSYANVNLGDSITFSCTLDKLDIKDGYGLSQLSQKIGYTTYANSDDIEYEEGKIELKDKVHKKVKDILDANLNSDNSEICFAVLFGQKYGLSDNIKDMFSYSGISHILAVSGLHVGVLVSIIWLCLNKLKINDYVKLVMFASVLLFYSYLCSFSPSVCRASLMAFTLALCKVFVWEYDIINSLGIAGTIILIVSPMSLFTTSFQLSFMCIFAIITFAPFLKKCLYKIKCPKVLADTLAISIAVNVINIPICMNTFDKVSLLGVFVNILVLPIFNVTYILLFVITLLSLIINSLGEMLFIPNLFLHLIKVIAYYSTLIPFGIIRVFQVSCTLIFLVALTTLIIHFLMLKHYRKFILVGVLSVICITIMIGGCLPKSYEDNKLIIGKQYNSNAVIYSYGDKNILIGSSISLNSIMSITKEARIKQIDKIIAYDLKLNNLTELDRIVEEFEIDDIIVPKMFEYDSITDRFACVEYFDYKYVLDDLEIILIEDKDDIIGIELKTINTKVLIPKIDNSKTENNNLMLNYSDVQYILADDYDFWIEKCGNIIDITNINKMFLMEI